MDRDADAGRGRGTGRDAARGTGRAAGAARQADLVAGLAASLRLTALLDRDPREAVAGTFAFVNGLVSIGTRWSSWSPSCSWCSRATG
ncbi:MAG TPA: hypothetical protein VKZ72_07030 [Acidimicrobiales bacterium]|nr:hypothetical protein [Acidimicrobiales bacterium]